LEGCSGNLKFEARIENLAGVFLTVRERKVTVGLFSPARFDETFAALRIWSKRPDAALRALLG